MQPVRMAMAVKKTKVVFAPEATIETVRSACKMFCLDVKPFTLINGINRYFHPRIERQGLVLKEPECSLQTYHHWNPFQHPNVAGQ